MRHIKELLEDNRAVGVVGTQPSDYLAHAGLIAQAKQSGTPEHSTLTLDMQPDVSLAHFESTARTLVPALASWIVREDITNVLSPERLTSLPAHRIVGRAVILAAMQAASEANRKISVLIGHVPGGVQGEWTVDPLLEDIPDGMNPVTSYSRITIGPGISSSFSVEADIATLANE